MPIHHRGLRATDNVVALHEGECSVTPNAKHREIGGDERHRPALADGHRVLVADDEQAAGGVEREGPWCEAACVDVLDERRLACRLVDPEDRDFVEPARRRAPVADIDELPTRMHVDRADRLPWSDTTSVRQRACAERRRRLEPVVTPPVRLESVLRLERQEHPRTRRVEVEMASAEADAVLWCDGDLIRQGAGLVAEGLQSARILA